VEAGFKRPVYASREYLLTETPPSNPQAGQHIWVLSLLGGGKPFPYLRTEFAEAQALLSSNGRWLAYRSTESRVQDVYVVSFPQFGQKAKDLH